MGKIAHSTINASFFRGLFLDRFLVVSGVHCTCCCSSVCNSAWRTPSSHIPGLDVVIWSRNWEMSNGLSGIMGGISVMDEPYSELCGVHSGVAGDDMESCDGASEANISSSPLPVASSASLWPVGPTMARIISTNCWMVRPRLEPWTSLLTVPRATSGACGAGLRKQGSSASSNNISWSMSSGRCSSLGAAVEADCDGCVLAPIPRICRASTKTAAIGNTFSNRWNGSGATNEAWPRLGLERGGVRMSVRGGASVAEERARK